MHTVHRILSLILILLVTQPALAGEYNAMASPLPPYAINKGLHVKGISVDILERIMTRSGVPLKKAEVKLVPWGHAFLKAAAGPHAILLNVPRTPDMLPMFKWVGPIDSIRYVIIGRKGAPMLQSLKNVTGHKVATIRGSFPEKALLKAGLHPTDLEPSVSCVLPFKKLNNKAVNYFAHADTSTSYLLSTMRLNLDDYTILYEYQHLQLYFAFSNDTEDAFILQLNQKLDALKQPGSNRVSEYEEIVAKYLPNGVLQ